MDTCQDKYLHEIAALMKRGKGQEIAEFFNNNQNSNEDRETFVTYMDGLIKKSKMSRARIADQVGLSRDYMYKVLRGTKTTTERDYIIAICLSMKANLLETQRALELYPFPELDINDQRSAIIMSGILHGIDCFTLDDWLDKLSLPMLKVSPDMPSAKIGPVRSKVFHQSLVNSKAVEGHEPSKLRSIMTMEKTNTFVVAEHFGMGPADFFFMAEFELTDDNGIKVYAQACFFPDGMSVFSISHHSVQTHMEDSSDVIEEYPTLVEARESAYFQYFLELDKLTDQKAADTLNDLNDTKTYGFRMGTKAGKRGPLAYSEAYNARKPELNEYIQVRQTETGYLYTGTHKSCFMQMELDDFYELYFGKTNPPLFLFETNSLDDLGPYEYYRESFEIMVENMQRKEN